MPSGVLVAGAVEGDTSGEEVICLKPKILMIDEEDAAQEQSGADQKKQGQGDLAGNHHGAETPVGPTGRRGASFVFQIGGDIGA